VVAVLRSQASVSFTPQEMFEALVAGFYDPNPCMVFEHKLLYGSAKGSDITSTATSPRSGRNGSMRPGPTAR